MVFCTDCQSKTITCPLNGDCYIECTTNNACNKAIINATQQNGSFELYCDSSSTEDDQICKRIEVFGSTLTNNAGTSFLVTCGRDRNVCTEAIINCALGMDCEVDCHSLDAAGTDGGKGSCSNAIINGPIGHDLRVECEDDNACVEATIHGEYSSTMNVTCFDGNGCGDITLFCPPNTNGNANCFLTGIAMLHKIYSNINHTKTKPTQGKISILMCGQMEELELRFTLHMDGLILWSIHWVQIGQILTMGELCIVERMIMNLVVLFMIGVV